MRQPAAPCRPSSAGTRPIAATSTSALRRDGTWYHQGTPFGRRELVRLFSTILRKDPDGYHLVTPAEKMRIRVDDAPFFAVSCSRDGEGQKQRLVFTTNVGDETVAGPENPIRVESMPKPASLRLTCMCAAVSRP